MMSGNFLGGSARPRVALLLDSAQFGSMQIRDGIASYAKGQGGWGFVIPVCEPGDETVGWLNGWRGNGLICHLSSGSLARSLAPFPFPVVDLMAPLHHRRNDGLEVDAKTLAHDVRRLILDSSFDHFAFCGCSEPREPNGWEDSFLNEVRRLGFELMSYRPNSGMTSDIPAMKTNFTSEAARLERWVRKLPPSTAILAHGDVRLRQVLVASARAGRLAPNQLGVMGVNESERSCNFIKSPLATIQTDARKLGFAAAHCLQLLMEKSLFEEQCIAV